MLTNYDYLTGIEDFMRMGGIRYKEEESDDYINASAKHLVPPVESLSALCDACHEIELAEERNELPEQRWLAQSLGTDYIELHTSGHIDMSSMHEVLRLLNPKAIIPIHTDNPNAFAKLFGDEWNVILLKDGESIACQK